MRTTKQTTPKYTADKSPGTSPRTGSGKRVSGTELGAVVTEVTYQTEAVRVTGLVYRWGKLRKKPAPKLTRPHRAKALSQGG